MGDRSEKSGSALLHGGNLNAICQLQKKQNSWKHSSLCLLKTLSNQGEITPNVGERQCSHRVASSLPPSWMDFACWTQQSFQELSLHQFICGSEPMLTQHPNQSN